MPKPEEIIKQITSYIVKNYDPQACGYTELRSEGNYTDVFQDGCTCGQSDTLYAIAQIIGLQLTEPEEPDYDFYD